MLTAVILLAAVSTRNADTFAANFANPPLSARPQTWWHWMNGNVTKAGITADLEAMKQVGIGGAEAFTVDQGIPAGPAKYDGPLWREMTAFAAKESARLGLAFEVHNGAGWSSSGGPWITPENAMQVIAWSEVKVEGPTSFSDQLPQPKAPQVDSVVPYYKDIAVYAYPTPPNGDVVTPRPADFLVRTGVERGDGLQVDLSPLKTDIAIPASKIIRLTDKLDASGKLTWEVPEGSWTILRIGHVPTGVHNHPAPPEGDGLEVDKLSKEALDIHWNAVMGKVVADAGPLHAGRGLNGVLIDSYEVGTQNWSPKFREDFQRLRGYDPLPWLPVIAGRIIDTKEKSERFLWDLRKTIADLYATNYYGHMAELAHKNGLLFSAEPYGNGGFDTITSGATADIPMAEFWPGGGAMETTKMVSSLCHTYGRPIVGAESFTSDVPHSRWREDPYYLKALGDQAFCNGINRYIFHRWAMQPWLTLKPGMTMGPWGMHMERTQTWWTEAATWMKYIARCQYLLQAGTFQADICYYYGDDSPNDMSYGSGLQPALPTGYDYDGCDAATLMKMTVKNGRIVLPSGMSYHLLVLPDKKFMTPDIAAKIVYLVGAGATIYGPRPTQSPSLTMYPGCDDIVRNIGLQVWGPSGGDTTGSHRFGKGHVVWGLPLGVPLAGLHMVPDFSYQHEDGTKLLDIHRKINGADVYFVSNQNYRNANAQCVFRISDRLPELWHPDTGLIEPAPAFEQNNLNASMKLHLGPAESVFVVFRKKTPAYHLTSCEPEQADSAKLSTPRIVIQSARYESADGLGADVTDKVRDMVKSGETAIGATNGNFGDPAVNVVKQLVVTYTLNGKPMKQTAPENDTVTLMEPSGAKIGAPEYTLTTSERSATLTAWKPGGYILTDSMRGDRTFLALPPRRMTLDQGWRVAFAPNLGAPPAAFFDKLISWTDSPAFGIKYFSGTATYTKTINVPASFLGSNRAVRLDLGAVKNFATVTVNGKTLEVLWKPPFALDVSSAIHVGENKVEVKVTNLWPNRLIGDEHFAPDAEWDGDHLKRWPDWLLNGTPRPKTGRIAFATYKFYDKNSPLMESGLIGPVKLESTKKLTYRY